MHARTAYLLLLLTTMFWGGNVVAGKLAVGHVSPMLLTAARWGLAFVVLLAIGWRRLQCDWPLVRRNLLLLTGLGAFGFAGFNLALYAAVGYTTAINVSIEQAGIPMLIFAVNFLLFRLSVSWAQILGFVMSLVGVGLTASHGDLARLLDLDVNFGDLLMVIGCIVYAGYTIALRFKPEIHWQSLMIVTTGMAFLATLPFVVAEFWMGAGIRPDLQGWAVVAYTVIFPSVIAQVFYIRCVEMIGANRAGLFINMVPIFGTLLSIAILREAFHAYHAVAFVLVLGGIWLAETSSRKTHG